MATQVQRRRGTTDDYINTAFRGAEGEFTYDKSAKTVRVHDGVTPGGFKLIRQAGSDLTPATKCKITYNKQGVITGGSDLVEGDMTPALDPVYVRKNNPITPSPVGEYSCRVRYDAKGLIVEGGPLTPADIPTGISQSKITNLESDLANKMDQITVETPTTTQGNIQLIDNVVNKVMLSGSATLVSPVVSGDDLGRLHQCLVQLYKPDIAYTVTFAATCFFGSNVAPDMESVGYYNIYYEFDTAQNAWVVGAIRKLSSAA